MISQTSLQTKQLVFFCAQKNPDALPRRGYNAFSREPGRTRTCDRLLRRQMLYPAELRDQFLVCKYIILLQNSTTILIEKHIRQD